MYALLGNDIEGEAPAQMPRENVRKTTLSKKEDVPPPLADPARARKNRKGPTGNEAALKAKNNNRDVLAPSSTPAKSQKKPFDRRSRLGKTDSKKKIQQGWGGDRGDRELDDEAAAASDAVAELEAEQLTAPAAKSLQDYLAELKEAQADLRLNKVPKNVVEDKPDVGERLVKVQETFVEATGGKKPRQKTGKEKKFLDVNAVFADEAPRREGFKKAPKGKKPSKPAKRDNFPPL